MDPKYAHVLDSPEGRKEQMLRGFSALPPRTIERIDGGLEFYISETKSNGRLGIFIASYQGSSPESRKVKLNLPERASFVNAERGCIDFEFSGRLYTVPNVFGFDSGKQ